MRLATDNLLVIGISIFLIFLIVIFFYLINTRSSNNIKIENSLLTILYPLKKVVVDLHQDLIEWNIQKVNYLRLGRINSINLKLNSGHWRRIYSRAKSEAFERLLAYLNQQKITHRASDRSVSGRGDMFSIVKSTIH